MKPCILVLLPLEGAPSSPGEPGQFLGACSLAKGATGTAYACLDWIEEALGLMCFVRITIAWRYSRAFRDFDNMSDPGARQAGKGSSVCAVLLCGKGRSLRKAMEYASFQVLVRRPGLWVICSVVLNHSKLCEVPYSDA